MGDIARQSTGRVLMVEPVNFFSNPSTKLDNAFQCDDGEGDVQSLALAEFLGLKQTLERSGVTVESWKDDPARETPDSIFPNNWFSTHDSGLLVLYPMRSEVRRRERRPDIVSSLSSHYPALLDFSGNEARELFLEGTGSMVLDRIHRVAYGCISSRTDSSLLKEWAKELDYSVCAFSGFDASGRAIYHTNVMMAVGTGYAVVCLECVTNRDEREDVQQSLKKANLEIVTITLDQMNHFCGNVLELQGRNGAILAMSSTAFDNFSAEQREVLERYAKIVHSPIPTIERLGGGSVRCMIAELF